MGLLDKKLFTIKHRDILVRDVLSLLLFLFICFVMILALLKATGVVDDASNENTTGEIEYHPVTDIVDEDIDDDFNDEDNIREQANEVTPCELSEINLIHVDELLASGDLCSEPWFKELDNYITRLEIQNDELEKQEGTQEIANVQKKLIARLKAFKKKQNDTTIDKLEEVVTEYQEVSTTVCTGGK